MWERINSLYLWMNSTEARQLFARQRHRFLPARRRLLAPVSRHHRRHAHPRRRLEFSADRQVPRTRRQHLAHPRSEVSHPAAARRKSRRQRRYRAMAGRAQIVQRFRGVSQAAHRPGGAVERRRVHHPPRQLPALHPLLRRRARRRACTASPAAPRAHFTTEAERLSGRLCSDLNYATIGDIFQARPPPVSRQDPIPAHRDQHRDAQGILRVA